MFSYSAESMQFNDTGSWILDTGSRIRIVVFTKNIDPVSMIQYQASSIKHPGQSIYNPFQK